MVDFILDCFEVIICVCCDVEVDVFYVVSLFVKGCFKIVQKFGEEVVEIVIVVCFGDDVSIVLEVVDLIFYLVVLFVDVGLSFDDVCVELVWCEGVGGLVEKVG